MLRRVARVRTEVLEERSAYFFRVTRIGKLGTTLALTSNRSTLRRNSQCASVVDFVDSCHLNDGGAKFL
jgi:hypothetical protein